MRTMKTTDDLLSLCREYFPGLTWTVLGNFPGPRPAYDGIGKAGMYVEVRTLVGGNAVVYSYLSYKLYSTTLMGGEPPEEVLSKAVTQWRDLAARVLAVIEKPDLEKDQD